MAVLDSSSTSLARVSSHGRGGLSYFAYALLFVLYAVVGRWMVSTVGEPRATAVAQLARIDATRLLHDGAARRNLLALQEGLSKAADVEPFNETLFDSSRVLLRGLRQRLEKLTEAVEAGPGAATAPLEAALDAAIELHSDGVPYVDRYHIRSAAKRLQEREKAAAASLGEKKAAALGASLEPLYARVAAALELGKESGNATAADDDADDEKKLPGAYLPAFWPCLAAFGAAIATALFFLSTHWSTDFRAAMFYHPKRAVAAGTFLKVNPAKHRGKAAIVVARQTSRGRLVFVFQRQTYEVVTDGAGYRVEPLGCPTALPLASYASAPGLTSSDAKGGVELFGSNSFEIPLPAFGELYAEQLSSPVACFQLFCAALWLLDEYWKYTLMTLGMILIFEATTAFSRQRNMQTLRGMSTRATQLRVFRSGGWATVPSTSLLPGDIVSLRREAGADAPVVPADCLLLRGRAVVNESTLTGESVPQMKDALTVEPKTADTALDMRGAHRVHVLFSGTSLVQHGGAAEVDAADAAAGGGGGSGAAAARNASEVPDPPDGGCVCYVLATAFSSSQGELMRMIEFSTAQVSSDKKETLLLLILPLLALLSAGYVMKRGLEEGKKSQYELALRACRSSPRSCRPSCRCRPPSPSTRAHGPRQGANLCTEPYRVPLAGKLTHTSSTRRERSPLTNSSPRAWSTPPPPAMAAARWRSAPSAARRRS